MTWVRHARYRMGTVWEAAVRASHRPQALAALHEAFEEVAQLERLMSRFLPISQVCAIADAAGRHAVPIAPALYEVLTHAQRIAAVSDRACDITIGPLVSLWGRAEGTGVMPTPKEIDEATALTDSGRLLLSAKGPTAFLQQAGMSLDLGAIGKGYALDAAVARLQRAGYTAGWVNAGGNVRVLGSWDRGVAVRDPVCPGRVRLQLAVTGGAVSTSAAYERSWNVGERSYGHLLDPRTGYPASRCLSATVLAPSGMLADALSTACFVLGPEQGAVVCHMFAGVEAFWFIQQEQADVTQLVTTSVVSGRRRGCVPPWQPGVPGADAPRSLA